MSSFFDKKEEVIQVELTQYGKHLLSKGEFVPVYYSFFDDDITYDWQYTGDSAELQNYAQDRILEETPSPKVQYVFSGCETSVTEANQHIRNNRNNLRDKKVQQTAEKHYALAAPLGNSDIATNYAPSWSAAALQGRFKESVRYQQGSQPTLKIPQIEVEPLMCRTYSKTSDMADTYEPDGARTADSGAPGSSSDVSFTAQQWGDGSWIDIACEHLLLEIEEQNTDCLKENFDIEVFLVEEEDTNGKVKTPGLALDKINKVEKLVPLKFGKRFSNIINGIMTDDEAPPKVYNYDPTFVEHYLEIRVDKEINNNILCEAGVRPDSRKCGGLSPTFLDCEDPVTAGDTTMYTSNSSGPYGDDC